LTDNLQNINKINDIDDVMSQIRQQFEGYVQNHLDTFFDSLKGVQFVFEQNSKADYKESINYKAIKAVINRNKTIKKEIIYSISSAFKYFKQGNYNFFINENLPVSNYQKPLLNDNHSDEMSIIHELISKTENANEKDLHVIANLFSMMAFDKNITFNQLPISPFVLVNSLVNSIKDMDLNPGIRMIIYNAFDVNVLLKIHLIYSQLVKKNSIKSNDKHEKLEGTSYIEDRTYKIITSLLKRYHKLKGDNKSKVKHINKNLIIQTLNIIQDKILIKNKSDTSFVPNSKKIKQLLLQGVVRLDKNAKGLDFSLMI